MYKVSFYRTKSGNTPIDDFILKSEKSVQSKISRQVKYLKEFGLTQSNPGLKKVASTNLWEARILGRNNIRIICVTIINERIVVLHIFKKKSQKTPRRELKLALTRYKDLTDDI
ncbi:type II toxin-antitoxin system RelE/ParE family toxin [Candidatus Microgenomates bacterium]|nr:type II toxin-antitoxin system RelE/ParE family toxin [Candidatus Microgenomates bacterium]